MNAKKAKRLRRVVKDMGMDKKFEQFMKGAWRINQERVLDGLKQYERKKGWR